MYYTASGIITPVGGLSVRSAHRKATYRVLNKLEYSKYSWHSCGDLKVVSLLMGLHLGYTKYCCFYVNGTAEKRLGLS